MPYTPLWFTWIPVDVSHGWDITSHGKHSMQLLNQTQNLRHFLCAKEVLGNNYKIMSLYCKSYRYPYGHNAVL